MEVLNEIIGYALYGLQAIMALEGLFFSILIWRRIRRIKFRNLDEQNEFLDQVDQNLKTRNFDAVNDLVADDPRVVPQLISLGIANRKLDLNRIRQLMAEHFQRDVLADFDYRLSWVTTAIKTAPMLGLLGTVLGMMGAFGNLASGDKVDPTMLANDISFALITTAVGLAVAIPLMLCVAAINVRIRKLEDQVSAGMTRFFDSLKTVFARA